MTVPQPLRCPSLWIYSKPLGGLPKPGKNVSESTIKKCFIKAGFLLEDESLVSFAEEHQEFDPLQELANSELVLVNSLLCNASSGSGTNVPSAGEALKADSFPPTCTMMTPNWEELFSSLSASTSQNLPQDNNDEDIIEVNATLKELKVKSLKEAMVILEDVIEDLTSENLTKTANDLSKVLSNIQSTWLSCKLKAVQNKVTEFFK